MAKNPIVDYRSQSGNDLPAITDSRWEIWTAPLFQRIKLTPMSITDIESWLLINRITDDKGKNLLAYLEISNKVKITDNNWHT